MCLCFYVYAIYNRGGGVVYTIPLYVKKTYNRVKLGLKNVFLCQNDICLYVFMFLGMLQYLWPPSYLCRRDLYVGIYS